MTIAEPPSISYEEVPYASRPVALAHPDVLYVAARRAGLEVARPEEARVLEIGCAEAANLLPMADRFERARFVGIDSGRAHIEKAIELRDRLGLENLELVCADVRDVKVEGTFDYVICHGMISWVAPEVRARVFALAREHLAEHGVAYVSYNVPAGFGPRGELRHALRARVRGASSATEALGHVRGFLGFVANNPFAESAHAKMLAEEASSALQRSDAYLVHEFLADINEPFRYSDVCSFAAAHALAAIGEMTALADAGAESSMREVVAAMSSDLGELDDLVDLLIGRKFRATLFARASAPLRPAGIDLVREVVFGTDLSAESKRLSLEPGDSEFFAAAGGVRVAVEAPLLKAALAELSRGYPLLLSFADLIERAEALLRLRRVYAIDRRAGDEERAALASDLLELAHLGHLTLRAGARELAVEPSARPRVSALSRLEAREHGWVTDALHRAHALDGPGAYLVSLLDGARDAEKLTSMLDVHLNEMGAELEGENGETLDGERRAAFLRGYTDIMLRRFAQMGIVLG